RSHCAVSRCKGDRDDVETVDVLGQLVFQGERQHTGELAAVAGRHRGFGGDHLLSRQHDPDVVTLQAPRQRVEGIHLVHLAHRALARDPRVAVRRIGRDVEPHRYPQPRETTVTDCSAASRRMMASVARFMRPMRTWFVTWKYSLASVTMGSAARFASPASSGRCRNASTDSKPVSPRAAARASASAAETWSASTWNKSGGQVLTLIRVCLAEGIAVTNGASLARISSVTPFTRSISPRSDIGRLAAR